VAGRAAPLPERCDQRAGALLAGEVGADVQHPGRALGQREQAVERGHAVDVGRGHLESAGDFVDGRPADPADGVVDGVQCGQQEVAPLPQRAATPPTGERDAEQAIEGRLLRRARRQSRKSQIHECRT
jgi:hypothetical protein